MLSKEQHIQYWQQSAIDDWETTQVLFNGKRFAFCLFSMHLYIEKLLKALWVKESITNTPPFTHDLVKLAAEADVILLPEQVDFLYIINSWNIKILYPVYSKNLHQHATNEYVQLQLEKITQLALCLDQKI